MFCPKCGAEQSGEPNYCGKCGQRLKPPEPAAGQDGVFITQTQNIPPEQCKGNPGNENQEQARLPHGLFDFDACRLCFYNIDICCPGEYYEIHVKGTGVEVCGGFRIKSVRNYLRHCPFPVEKMGILGVLYSGGSQL